MSNTRLEMAEKSSVSVLKRLHVNKNEHENGSEK